MNAELPVLDSAKGSSCCSGFWLLVAGLLGASGVALGAFEAHSLEGMLAESGISGEEIADRMHNCEVAVRYQMLHALAFFALAVAARTHGGRWLHAAGAAWLAGSLLFSGTLYVLVFVGKLGGIHYLVPIGGLLQIIGWLALAIAAVVTMGCCRRR